MAVHALWEDRYGLSYRKGPIDLTNILTGASTSATDQDAASHDNTGAKSNVTVSAVEYGGDQHFWGTTATIAEFGQGHRMGQGNAGATTTIDFIYGQPVTGNPSMNPGQNILEFQKTDGEAVGRVSASTATGVSGSNLYRGGAVPTFSCETIPTSKSLTSLMAGFFHNGLKEDTTTKEIKIARFPKGSSGSDPLWVGAWLRRMSVSGADSQLLSDCVATGLNLGVSTDGVLTASSDWTGRILLTDVQASTLAGPSGSETAADLTLDDGKNYLMTDCQVLISDNESSPQYYLTEISDFSLNMSSNVGVQRYNDLFPYRFVMGDYTAEGSITIPWSSGLFGNANVGQEFFFNQLMKAGSAGMSPSPILENVTIGLYWRDSGFSGASGSVQTLPTSIATARDLHIVLNAFITDVQLVGDLESEMQISFRCMNQYDTSDAVSAAAVKIATYDDLDETWGFNAASSLYTTESA